MNGNENLLTTLTPYLTFLATSVALVLSVYNFISSILKKAKVVVELDSTALTRLNEISHLESKDYLKVRLAFQNSGELLTSALKFRLYLDKNNFIEGCQIVSQKEYPDNSISGGMWINTYTDKVYPLELPSGKACHFTVLFELVDKVQNAEQLTLKIDFIKHRQIILTIPKLGEGVV